MKKMYKRIISSLLAATLSLSGLWAFSASAAEPIILTEIAQPRMAVTSMEENTALETLTSAPADASAILTAAPKMVQMLNDMVVQNQYEDFTVGDIQASQFIKVYVPETDLFSMNTTDADTILATLNNDIYMYVAYLPMGEKYAVVEVSKGLPLSEEGAAALSPEEQAQIQAQAGKWQVTGVGEIDQPPAYLDAALDGLALEENGVARLVGGLQEFRQPVALIFSEEELETISLVNGAVLTGSWSELDALTADGTEAEDGLLDFSQTAAIIQETGENGTLIQSGVQLETYETNPATSLSSSPIYDLNVTRIQQDSSTWCWAACASMIANYQINFLRCNQAYLVQHLKNQNNGYLAANEGAYDSGIIFAIEYMLENRYTVSKSGAGTYTSTRSYIMSNKAPAAKIVWETGGSNHLVVLGGTYDGYNSVFVIDPWFGCGKMWYQYSRLLSSNTFQSGSKGRISNLFKY